MTNDPNAHIPIIIMTGAIAIAICISLGGLYLLTNEAGVEWSSVWTFKFWQVLSEILRNVGLFAIAPVGLWLAWDRSKTATREADTATREAETAERGQNTDRFQKAAAMLGDVELSVREAGIFILKEIAEADHEVTICRFKKLFVHSCAIEANCNMKRTNKK